MSKKKEQQEFIAEHYDTIRDILESYKNNEIGFSEAIHCFSGIIELAIKKFKN
jgi:predicted nucleic-acid-binding protein